MFIIHERLYFYWITNPNVGIDNLTFEFDMQHLYIKWAHLVYYKIYIRRSCGICEKKM
jgi:hypothetical protein